MMGLVVILVVVDKSGSNHGNKAVGSAYHG